MFIFDGINEAQSFQILDRIHSELTRYFSQIIKQAVTFSAGIIAVDSGSQTVSYKDLLGQVDNLLYEAKRLGRARAVGHQGDRIFSE